MKTFRHRIFVPLGVTLALAMAFVTVAYAANYHGIHVNYYALSYDHFGNLWLSYGHIDTSQDVDQIGTNYWSVLEYCNGKPVQASWYSFNGSLEYNYDTYTRSFFRYHYGCSGNATNKFRTYIQFEVQDWPYSAEQWPDTDWATW